MSPDFRSRGVAVLQQCYPGIKDLGLQTGGTASHRPAQSKQGCHIREGMAHP